MTVWMKNVVSVFLILVAVQGLLMQSFLSTWGFLELSSLMFLGLMGQDYLKKRHNEVMKFFLIQAFSGMMIFVFFTLSMSLYPQSSFLLSMILLFKMGLVPFHTWFLMISTSFSWENLYLFLTSQKAIPLHLLSNYTNFSLTLVALASWIISSISSLSSKSIKKLIIYSSLFMGGMLLFLLTYQFDWIKFLVVYSLITLPIFTYNKNLSLKKNCSIEEEASSSGGVWVWLLFLNLGGIPPLPGFFLKLNFITSMNFAFLELMLFLTTSIVLLYMYLSLGFSSLIKSDYLMLSNKSTTRHHLYVFLQFMLLIMFLILWMGVTT